MKDPVSRFPLLCLLVIIVISVLAHAVKNIAAPLLSAINIFTGPVWDTLKFGFIIGLIGTVLIFLAILYLMSIAPTQQVKQFSTQGLDYPHFKTDLWRKHNTIFYSINNVLQINRVSSKQLKPTHKSQGYPIPQK